MCISFEDADWFLPEDGFAFLLLEPEDEAGSLPGGGPAGQAGQAGRVPRHCSDEGAIATCKHQSYTRLTPLPGICNVNNLVVINILP